MNLMVMGCVMGLNDG